MSKETKPGERAHAKLSPSSSSRWLSCTASHAEIEKHPELVKDTAGFAAEEGTLAHAVLENEHLLLLGKRSKAEYDKERKVLVALLNDLLDEGAKAYATMAGYAQQQIDLIDSLTEGDKGAFVALEVRVDPKIPHCFGTSDAVVITGTDLHVVDYKYGMGIPVSPVENSQLMLYGLGALEEYDLVYDIETVHLHIVQPRIDNVRSWSISADDLRTWREEVALPAAKVFESFLDGDDGIGVYEPGEKQCQWCPAKPICPARAQHILDEAFGEFESSDFENIVENVTALTVDELTPEQIVRVVLNRTKVEAWMKQLEAYVIDQAKAGNLQLPGVKVVKGSSRRVLNDTPELRALLLEGGYEEKDFVRVKESLITLSQMEKLLGEKLEKSIVQNYVEVKEGPPKVKPGDPSESNVADISDVLDGVEL